MSSKQNTKRNSKKKSKQNAKRTSKQNAKRASKQNVKRNSKKNSKRNSKRNSKKNNKQKNIKMKMSGGGMNILPKESQIIFPWTDHTPKMFETSVGKLMVCAYAQPGEYNYYPFGGVSNYFRTEETFAISDRLTDEIRNQFASDLTDKSKGFKPTTDDAKRRIKEFLLSKQMDESMEKYNARLLEFGRYIIMNLCDVVCSTELAVNCRKNVTSGKYDMNLDQIRLTNQQPENIKISPYYDNCLLSELKEGQNELPFIVHSTKFISKDPNTRQDIIGDFMAFKQQIISHDKGNKLCAVLLEEVSSQEQMLVVSVHIKFKNTFCDMKNLLEYLLNFSLLLNKKNIKCIIGGDLNLPLNIVVPPIGVIEGIRYILESNKEWITKLGANFWESPEAKTPTLDVAIINF
jgi:hypothetical protein